MFSSHLFSNNSRNSSIQPHSPPVMVKLHSQIFPIGKYIYVHIRKALLSNLRNLILFFKCYHNFRTLDSGLLGQGRANDVKKSVSIKRKCQINFGGEGGGGGETPADKEPDRGRYEMTIPSHISPSVPNSSPSATEINFSASPLKERKTFEILKMSSGPGADSSSPQLPPSSLPSHRCLAPPFTSPSPLQS